MRRIRGWEALFAVGLAALSLFLPPPALAASGECECSSEADVAITAAVALGAAVIAAGFTWLSGWQGRNAVTRGADDAELRRVRQQAADDLQTINDLGASLREAVSRVVETGGAGKGDRQDVKVASAALEARLGFIWDDEFRRLTDEFARRARASADASDPEQLRTSGDMALKAWEAARERSGLVWRTLMSAVIQARDVLPDEGAQAAPTGSS